MPVTIIRRKAAGPAKEKPVNRSTSAQPTAAPMPGTLADVEAKIEASTLPDHVKRDTTWAIHAFARGTGRTPSDIRADAVAIREHLAAMSPAMLGLEPGSFRNLKALLRRAFKLTGRAIRPRTRMAGLTPEWEQLHRRLPTQGARARLGGFISYCSSQGYHPGDISNGHLERYIHLLQAESIDPKWPKTIERTAKAWNRAVDELDFWPKAHLTLPWKQKEAFTLPLEAFPESFRQSISDYLGYLLDPPVEDDLAPLKPLRPGSTATRLFRLRYLGSVLLDAGWPASKLTSVNDLVTPEALEVLLNHKVPPAGKGGQSQYHLHVTLLKSIAKYWAASPKVVVDHLSRIINRYTVKVHSMAPKNRRKLAELSGEDVRARLLTLAPRVYRALAAIKDDDLTARDAALALAALYVELALMWPARVGTLSRIHLTKNLVRSGHGRSARVFLHFEAEQVKNDMPLEVELPPQLITMLDTYVARYRPLLVVAPSDYLFPARNGGPRSGETMWRSVTSITKRYVGRPINPHLFRHLTATMFLERRPGDYETVRRTLAHRSHDMAHRHYVGLDDRAAVRRFDDVILQMREEVAPARRRRRRQPSSQKDHHRAPRRRGSRRASSR